MLFISGIFSSDSTLIDKKVSQTASYAELAKQGRFEDLFDKFLTWSIDFGGKMILAILLFFVGRFLINLFKKLIGKIMDKRSMDIALKGFLQSLVNTILFIMLFILIINIVGKQTVSLAALIASAGLAIGLAVKDNLANFAGGVMILLNKPFRGGDFIKAGDMEGVVQNIGVLYTTLRTYDNKTIFIPNGPLSTGNIINFNTIDGLRRVDLTVSVDYGSDVEEVKQLLLEIANAHPSVLKEPEPFARMTKMNDSSIDFTFRAWVKFADFWTVTCDLNESVYKRLNEKGLNIPFPQMTVHLAESKQNKTKEE